jgi:hypothetical protein
MRRHKSDSQPVQIARQAVDAARSAASNIDVADVRDSVSTELSKDVDLVLDETRHRPMRALLIALGVGAVIGAAIDRASRRRTPEPQSR